jgi:hypothetical protein
MKCISYETYLLAIGQRLLHAETTTNTERKKDDCPAMWDFRDETVDSAPSEEF